MNTPTIVALVSLVVNVVLGAVVWSANPRRATNRQFLVLNALGSFWLMALACSFSSKDEPLFLLWFRTTTSLGVLVLLGFRWVRLAMQGSGATLRELLERSRWHLCLVVALIVFSWTDLNVAGATFPLGGIPNTVNGSLVVLYPLGFLLLALWEVRLLVRAKRVARGIQRFEMNFLLVGAGLMIVSGALPAMVVPLLADHSQGVALAPLWIVFMDGATAYGIATRRIMDVSAWMRVVISWALLGFYIVACYGLVFYAVMKVSGMGSWEHSFSVPGIAATIFLVFSFGWAQNRLDVFLNKTFVSHDRIDPMKDWEKAREVLNKVTTTPQLLERFSGMLSKTANTDRSSICLLEDGQARPAIEGRLQLEAKPLLASALARQREDEESGAILNELAGGDWELAMGIYREERLVGVVYLAERLSGRIYTQEEQTALAFLVDQFSGALENAMLYTEVANRERHNKTLLDNLISGVIATDLDGKVTMTNPETQRILANAGSEEWLPDPLKEFLGEILETGDAQHDVEMDVALEQGDPCSLRVGGAMLSNDDGSPIGALMVIHDISAQRLLEQHVRHSDRLATIGKVSASVAHEIKNPLVAIKSFVQLLPERKTDQEFLESFSRLVDSEVGRIDTAIGGLLNYARTDSTELAVVGVHDEVRSSVELLGPEFKKKRLEVSLDLAAAKDGIEGHAGQIRQLMVNLLLNANDAVQDNGAIWVATRVLDEDGNALQNGSVVTSAKVVELRIRDNGQGIADVDMNQVLMPFFTTKKGGTGLGLPLVASLVSQHGGLMDIESTVGEGTTIILTFPLTGDDAMEAVSTPCDPSI